MNRLMIWFASWAVLYRLFFRNKRQSVTFIRDTTVEYQVKDANGVVVATFFTEAQGPFSIEPVPFVVSGGGGPGVVKPPF